MLKISNFTPDEYEIIECRCNFNKFNGEYETYYMLKDGASITQISQKLNISERTVNRRIKSIRLKIFMAVH